VIRRSQSMGSFMHRERAETEDEDDTTPLLGRSHTMPTEAASGFGLTCIKYGGSVRALEIESRLPPAKSNRAARTVSGYFRALDVNVGDEDLDDMPEVKEALHVNAGLCAMGYRYERLDQLI